MFFVSVGPCSICRGPQDTCFEGGVFQAVLSFPSDYPLSPPKMRFTCDMFHPNSKSQHLCQHFHLVVILFSLYFCLVNTKVSRQNATFLLYHYIRASLTQVNFLLYQQITTEVISGHFAQKTSEPRSVNK